ncbi:MAG TPA: hypothetical protein VMZ91_13890 [Candidatus Paceibacterota bacterium]|nr:hypothetical protein [Candidatus Paceibacterota bacterium]
MKCKNKTCNEKSKSHKEGYCDYCFYDLQRIRRNNKKFEEEEE